MGRTEGRKEGKEGGREWLRHPEVPRGLRQTVQRGHTAWSFGKVFPSSPKEQVSFNDLPIPHRKATDLISPGLFSLSLEVTLGESITSNKKKRG